MKEYLKYRSTRLPHEIRLARPILTRRAGGFGGQESIRQLTEKIFKTNFLEQAHQ